MFQATCMLFLLVCYMSWSCSQADIIAYDCSDPDTEVSRISLLQVQPCADLRNATEKLTRRIQLVQERLYTEVHVYSCLVTIQRQIQHCGMHSHTSTVAGGFAKYVHLLKVEACLNAHKFRRLDLSGIGAGILANLVLNGTTEASPTLAGQLTPTGQCQGVQYTDGGITYEDVVVIAAISIKLMDYTATANVDEDAVTLRTGTICRYKEKYCFDDQAGEVTWEANPIDRCSATGIDVLFYGSGNGQI